MRSLIELLVLGTGLAITAILAVFTIFGANIELLENPDPYLYIIQDGLPILLVMSPGVFCALGVIIDQIAYVLFWPWENSFRKSIQPLSALEPKKGKKTKLTNKYYFQVRNYIFSHQDYRALAANISENRFKIRIARGWALNALLVNGLLISREVNMLAFDPFLFPFIAILTLVTLGCIWAWQNYMSKEIRWYETFNEGLLR